jgi:hypothetical protein
MSNYAGNLDFISGVDLPGELIDSDGWQDEVLVRCSRCGDQTGWPQELHGRVHCPPCVWYEQRDAYAATLAGAA